MDSATQQAIIAFTTAFLLVVVIIYFWVKIIKQEQIPLWEFIGVIIAIMLATGKVSECASAEEFKNNKLVSTALQTMTVANVLFTLTILAQFLLSPTGNSKKKKED